MMNEKEIIAIAAKYLNQSDAKVLKGIGDDCAVTIGSTKKQLYTSDMLIENTHFLLQKISPYFLGWKSLAVNISDIASMGGVPKYALLSLGINSKVDIQWIEEFYQGLSECAATFKVAIIGGDTVKSNDSIVINIALTGECDHPVFRDNIKPGDLIFSTGYLGLSGAGFWCIQNNVENNYCIEKHCKPMPRVKEGLFLNGNAQNISMIDSSDGLYKSIETMCELSDLGAEIYFQGLDVHEQLNKISIISKIDTEQFILYGGEDYELIFAISEPDYQLIKDKYFLTFNQQLIVLGKFTDNNKDINLIKNNKAYKLNDNSFKHF